LRAGKPLGYQGGLAEAGWHGDQRDPACHPCGELVEQAWPYDRIGGRRRHEQLGRENRHATIVLLQGFVLLLVHNREHFGKGKPGWHTE
jgi:hypothetical protein